MASIPSRAKLIGRIERTLYSKAHMAMESYRQSACPGILSEADPHPRVEKDIDGELLIPSQAEYGRYFQMMQAKYIQDQIAHCEARWKEVADKKDKKAEAERTALTRELEAAKEALKNRQ